MKDLFLVGSNLKNILEILCNPATFFVEIQLTNINKVVN